MAYLADAARNPAKLTSAAVDPEVWMTVGNKKWNESQNSNSKSSSGTNGLSKVGSKSPTPVAEDFPPLKPTSPVDNGHVGKAKGSKSKPLYQKLAEDEQKLATEEYEIGSAPGAAPKHQNNGVSHKKRRDDADGNGDQTGNESGKSDTIITSGMYPLATSELTGVDDDIRALSTLVQYTKSYGDQVGEFTDVNYASEIAKLAGAFKQINDNKLNLVVKRIEGAPLIDTKPWAIKAAKLAPSLDDAALIADFN